jgi:hypothetical protein
MKGPMQKIIKLYQCMNFEAIKPTNLNNGYLKIGF